MQLRLSKTGQDGEGGVEIYRWTEVSEARQCGYNEVKEVHFRWPVCT